MKRTLEKKVLVVDDDEVVRMALMKLLEASGYTAVGAGDAEAALAIADQEHIQVFFLDLEMPGMDGIELCRELRRRRPLDCIYAVTAHTSVYDVVRCRDAGFDDYFAKPFDHAMIRKAVAEAFDKLARWQAIQGA